MMASPINMKRKKSIFFFLYIITASLKLLGQDTVSLKLDLKYENEQYDHVLADMGERFGYRIYYQPHDLADLTTSLSLNKITIDSALHFLFKNKPFYFFTRKKEIFITKNKKIEALVMPLEKPMGIIAKENMVDLAPASAPRANMANKLYEVGIRSNLKKQDSAIVTGYLIDELSNKPIAGGIIATTDRKNTVSTNNEGKYKIKLSIGLNNLVINAGQLRTVHRQIMLLGDGGLNIAVKENTETLKEVNIVAQKASNIKSLELGVNKLSIKTIRQVPSVFGEPDVLRVVMTLPGVQSVGEASTGFNVRGGSVDQNLILLDNSTIYNPSHFFGFFSAFNPDLVKDIQLYKSTIPEQFGGRLSAVLEVVNRQGDRSKFKGSAGIGLITSRLNIEGPIDSGKTSFILGGRTTYSNWLLKLLPDEYKNSKASFYDINLGINHLFKKGSELNVMAYHSRDNFSLNSDTSYQYSNKSVSAEWRKTFSKKLQGVFILGIDGYDYSVSSDQNQVNAYRLKFSINQTGFKSNFKYAVKDDHLVNFGLSTTLYQLKPGQLLPQGTQSLVTPDIVETEKALESAVFFGDEYKINDKFSLNVGFRYSLYNYLGPKEVSYYMADRPKSDITVTEIKKYGNNEQIETYHFPEIRLAARYALSNDFSIKAAYNTLYQYIHLLSNTTTVSPTDIWKLSDPNIRPQKGSQVALGIYKNFNSQSIETSIEGYYKKLVDYLDYKSGASLILNHHIEQDVIRTKGKAYGIEFLLKKNAGKLNGWLSYTYSRILLKMDNINEGTLVNGGKDYPANYDKPHAFNFTGNYRFKQRYHFSLNFTYSTGRPITLPIAKYVYAGSERVYYADRNAYRIPDYLRVDASFNIEGNHKIKQLAHNSWTIGVYNLTGRRNVFSTFFTQENGAINGYNLSIFATAIPFINYNIRF